MATGMRKTSGGRGTSCWSCTTGTAWFTSQKPPWSARPPRCFPPGTAAGSRPVSPKAKSSWMRTCARGPGPGLTTISRHSGQRPCGPARSTLRRNRPTGRSEASARPKRKTASLVLAHDGARRVRTVCATCYRRPSGRSVLALDQLGPGVVIDHAALGQPEGVLLGLDRGLRFRAEDAVDRDRAPQRGDKALQTVHHPALRFVLSTD